MQRLLQLAALALAITVTTFFACRAQPSSKAPDRGPAASSASGLDAGPDAAVRANPAPEVYLPASKSGGMLLQHQQAPR